METTIDGQEYINRSEPELGRFHDLRSIVPVVIKEDKSELKILSLNGFWFAGPIIVIYPICILVLFCLIYSVLNQCDYVVVRLDKVPSFKIIRHRIIR